METIKGNKLEVIALSDMAIKEGREYSQNPNLLNDSEFVRFSRIRFESAALQFVFVGEKVRMSPFLKKMFFEEGVRTERKALNEGESKTDFMLKSSKAIREDFIKNPEALIDLGN